MMKAALILALCIGCTMPDPAVDRKTCTNICAPNDYMHVKRTLGKIVCECDVQTEGGVVRSGPMTSHWNQACNGRAIKRVTVTSFDLEDVECAR